MKFYKMHSKYSRIIDAQQNSYIYVKLRILKSNAVI